MHHEGPVSSQRFVIKRWQEDLLTAQDGAFFCCGAVYMLFCRPWKFRNYPVLKGGQEMFTAYTEKLMPLLLLVTTILSTEKKRNKTFYFNYGVKEQLFYSLGFQGLKGKAIQGEKHHTAKLKTAHKSWCTPVEEVMCILYCFILFQDERCFWLT